MLVSNEVGLGIVPDNAMARTFRDLAGSAHQRLAEICDDVYFIVAGLPMTLKGETPSRDAARAFTRPECLAPAANQKQQRHHDADAQQHVERVP